MTESSLGWHLVGIRPMLCYVFVFVSGLCVSVWYSNQWCWWSVDCGVAQCVSWECVRRAIYHRSLLKCDIIMVSCANFNDF